MRFQLFPTAPLIAALLFSTGCGPKGTTTVNPPGGENGGGETGNGGGEVKPPEIPAEEFAGKGASELIASLADDTNWEKAAEELKVNAAEVVAPLREALASESADVRRRAAFTLGTLGSAAKEAVADLRRLAENDNDRTVADTASFAADAIEEK